MTKQHINIGDSVNDKRGDPLRTAFDKVNQNFDELYNSVSAVVVAGATAPTTPGVGDLWYDTNSGRTYVYYDSTWVDASPVDGAGIASTNELVNGNKTVSLDPNGLTTFPTFQTGTESLSIQGSIVGSTNAGLSILAKNEVLISTDLLGNQKNWNFGTEGKLTLPAGTTYEYVNVPLTGHGDGLARLDFELQTDGVVTEWMAASPNPAGSGYNIGDTFTFDAEFLGIPGASVTIEVLTIGVGGGIVELGFTPPPLYPADIYRDSPINIQVGAESNRWTFKSDGKLTLPNGSTIGDGDAVFGVPITTTRGSILIGNQAECLGGENHFHIMKAGQQDIDLFLGDDNNYVKLPSTGGVEISSSEIGAQHYWTFGTDGNLTLPPGSSRITSYGQVTIETDNNGSGMYANATGVNLLYANTNVTLRANSTGTNKDWTFGTDGALTLPPTHIITAALSQQVGTIITDIEAWNWHNGTGNPYAWNQWNPAFLSLYNIGDSIIGWSFYSDADPSNVVTITARNPDISELTFSGDLGSPPYVAQSPDYVPFHGNPVVIQTQGPQFQADWTFGSDGNLTAPGTITAPNLIVDDGNISFLGNGSGIQGAMSFNLSTNNFTNNWNFGEDGLLTFPGADGFQATFGSVEPVGDVLQTINNLLLSSESEVSIRTDSASETSPLWTFGTDGTTQFPSNRITQTLDTDLTVRLSETLITDVTSIVPGTGYSNGTATTTGGSGTGLIISINTDGAGHVNQAHNFISLGQGYKIGDVITIVGGNNDAQVTLTGSTPNRDWTFSADGTTTFPGSANISTINVSQINGTNPGDELIIQANNYNWTFGTGGELSLPTNGYTEAVIKELNATALVLFAQSTGGNIKLLAGSTSAAGAKQWLFNGTDGSATFPGTLTLPNGAIISDTAASPGLLKKKYSGTFVLDPTWFAANAGNLIETTTISSTIQSTDLEVFDAFSFEFTGYFVPPTSANYTFRAHADETFIFWIGAKALSGYTYANKDMYGDFNGTYPEQQTQSFTIALTAGQFYPIRIQWGNSAGWGVLDVFTWANDAGQANTANFTGHIYTANTGTAKIAVNDNKSIILSTDNATDNNWTFTPNGQLVLPNNSVIKDTAGDALAFGRGAGTASQGSGAIAIGWQAGNVGQGAGSVALGEYAGLENQGTRSVAIGERSGQYGQGAYAIAIGLYAGQDNQHANSIILNASGGSFNSDGTSRFYVNPIRNDSTPTNVLLYNTTTKEVTYGVSPKTQGTFTLGLGTNAISITLDVNATYTMWLRATVDNGVISYNATVTITNVNLPVLGQQQAYAYSGAGTVLDWVSLPTQIVGTAGSVIRSPTLIATPANVFEFYIQNDSEEVIDLHYGYTKI